MKPGKMKVAKTFLVVPALALFVSACAQAPVGWQKPGGEPGASKEQWDRDRSACRFQARKEADKRFGQLGSEIGSPVYSTTPTLARDMEFLKAKKHERRLF